MIITTMITNTIITMMSADAITTTMMSMNMYTEAAALAANMTTMKKS
jgi:hypothetical protein